MSDSTCLLCGQHFQAVDLTNERCSECASAGAIAKPSPQIVAGAGAYREGSPSLDSVAVPSILKEHHASFLRLFLFFFAAWLLVALSIAFFAYFGV